MPRYLLLKHYKGSPAPPNWIGMEHWSSDEVQAHIQYMRDFADRLRASGEFVDENALSSEGRWVHAGDDGGPPVVDGPFAETKDLIAGWMIIDVASWERCVELAGELSAAPGKDGRPINERLEVRPLYGYADTITE